LSLASFLRNFWKVQNKTNFKIFVSLEFLETAVFNPKTGVSELFHPKTGFLNSKTGSYFQKNYEL